MSRNLSGEISAKIGAFSAKFDDRGTVPTDNDLTQLVTDCINATLDKAIGECNKRSARVDIAIAKAADPAAKKTLMGIRNWLDSLADDIAWLKQ